MNTQHIKGPVGLKAGTQPPPHWYVLAPLVYVYETDTVKTAEGNTLLGNANITVSLAGGGVSYVSTRKILGGFYGFQLLFPAFVNNRLQGTEIDFDPGGGLTDSVVTPINLGWHFNRADVMTAYNIFVPTGRYNDGATDNLGFGMSGHEVAVGIYARTTREGGALTIMATFPLAPIRLPAP